MLEVYNIRGLLVYFSQIISLLIFFDACNENYAYDVYKNLYEADRENAHKRLRTLI